MHFSLIQFTLPSVSTRLILIPSWASLAHFIPLGILDPSHSCIPMGFCEIFRASLFQLLYPLLLGFVGFTPISFTNSFLWALLAHLYLLFTSYDSHGLTTSFFEAPLGPFAFFGIFYYFVDLCTIVPTIRTYWFFLLC